MFFNLSDIIKAPNDSYLRTFNTLSAVRLSL